LGVVVASAPEQAQIFTGKKEYEVGAIRNIRL
jgi:hypothetical protein